jgi:hypothetical protein
MDWQDLRRRYVSMLSDMGFRPEIDSDGDIHFRYEGGSYYVTDNCDDTYFFLMYPGFWSPENGNQQLAALMAANATNRRIKAAKVMVNSSMDRVGVTLECLIGEPADVRSFLMRGLRIIQQAVTIFMEEVRELLK